MYRSKDLLSGSILNTHTLDITVIFCCSIPINKQGDENKTTYIKKIINFRPVLFLLMNFGMHT